MDNDEQLTGTRVDAHFHRQSTAGKDITFGAGSLLVTFSGQPCDVHFVYRQGRARRQDHISLGEGSSIIASPQRVQAFFGGMRDHCLIDEGDLCCILAFVDAALTCSIVNVPSTEAICCQPVPDAALRHHRELGHWLALHAIKGTADNALIRHLRRKESYGLASYLLQKPSDCTHLNQLCVEYGLSYSHFRRLCRRSLGHAIKTRLRAWRAARTVLDIIDSKQPILDIAVENGYTSASHVSSDVKQLFGFTPRTARNARRLLP